MFISFMKKKLYDCLHIFHCRFLKGTMVNDSKRIGYIGLVPECSTGTKVLSFVNKFSIENFNFVRYLPRSVGMRRIALHKSVSIKGDKMYLLVCECADLLKDISAAAVLIPALRARLCGYTGLYRPIQAF